jgi:hypothetical protein
MLQFADVAPDGIYHPTLRSPDPARVEGSSDLRESLAENQEVYNFLRAAAAGTAWASGNLAPA